MANRRRNNRPNGGGGPRPQHNKATVFDSNGPDVRIRGTAFQIVEKYMTLAKDASASGDRVLAENYLQHAEHYQRVINSWAEESPARPYYGGNRNETTSTGYGSPHGGETPDGFAPDSADAPTEDVVMTRRASAPRASEEDENDLGLPASILGRAGGNAPAPKSEDGASADDRDRAGPPRARRIAITAV